MCRVEVFRSHLLAKQEGNDGKKTKQQERLSLKFWESGFLLRHMQRQRRPLSMQMCCMDEMRFVDRLLGADPRGLSHYCGLLIVAMPRLLPFNDAVNFSLFLCSIFPLTFIP